MNKNILLAILILLAAPSVSLAASAKLLLYSNSGAYSINKELPIKLVMNSGGEPGINAVESKISFNPKELNIKRIELTNSIFDLWPLKPKINNASGTLSFAGGTTKPYKGLAGTILTIIFAPQKNITTNITLSTSTSQALTADNLATNILTQAAGGSYQIVSKLNYNKLELYRNKSLGKVLINDKQKNNLSYVNPLDRLRYDFATSTEIEYLYKRFAQKNTSIYIKKYEKSKFPTSVAGKFLSSQTGTTTTYYYIGPISRKSYKLDSGQAAYKLFQGIGAPTPWAEISRIPNGI
ncbi:MAG: hypothetical protein WCG01_01570 [bacterium]